VTDNRKRPPRRDPTHARRVWAQIFFVAWMVLTTVGLLATWYWGLASVPVWLAARAALRMGERLSLAPDDHAKLLQPARSHRTRRNQYKALGGSEDA
jgi:hypothetical protein